MAKTQSERLDDIETKQELLVTQQRVLIQQNDKVLEFVDAIYQALAASIEEMGAPPEDERTQTGSEVNEELVKLFSQGQQEEKKMPWGWERQQAREAEKNGD